MTDTEDRTQPQHHDEIGVLIRAALIPSGFIVTKPTGVKRYTLQRSFRIFDKENGKTHSFQGIFLIPEHGHDSIDAIEPDRILAVRTTIRGFMSAFTPEETEQ